MQSKILKLVIFSCLLVVNAWGLVFASNHEVIEPFSKVAGPADARTIIFLHGGSGSNSASFEESGAKIMYEKLAKSPLRRWLLDMQPNEFTGFIQSESYTTQDFPMKFVKAVMLCIGGN